MYTCIVYTTYIQNLERVVQALGRARRVEEVRWHHQARLGTDHGSVR